MLGCRASEEVRRAGRPLRSWARTLLLGTLAVVLATSGCNRRIGGGEFLPGAQYVLPPEEVNYGLSTGEWTARWWQWAFEQTRTGHPLYDLTGVDATRGQAVPVWFLCGAPGAVGPVNRTVDVPAGTALFFPVVAEQANPTNCQQPDLPYSVTDMRELLDARMAAYHDIFCAIDGDVVVASPDFVGASRWRAQALGFETWLPDDNILFDACGGSPPPARVVSPVASDGIWLMIGPMPSGGHTVQFRYRQEGFPITFVDVTYHINVLR